MSLKDLELANVARAANASMDRAYENIRLLQEQDAQRGNDRHQALITLSTLGKANLASEFHARLEARIKAFEGSLDQTQEVGL